MTAPSCGCESEPHTCESEDDLRARERIEELEAEIARVRAESAERLELAEEAMSAVRRMAALINTPRTDEWSEAVRIEAAHQIDRWGVEHDAGKRPEDWIALLVYLLGKATAAHFANDTNKLAHHIISTSAALLNWHRALVGDSTAMRPGVGPAIDGLINGNTDGHAPSKGEG